MSRSSFRLQQACASAFLGFLMLTMPTATLAQNNPSIIPASWTAPPCDITTGELKASCIPEFIGHLIQTLFGLVSVFFLLNVIFAGYQMAMGSWTGEKSQGKDRLTWSIIGLIVSVCCFLILDLVISVIT